MRGMTHSKEVVDEVCKALSSQVYTIPEAESVFGVPQSTLRAWCRKKKIKFKPVNWKYSKTLREHAIRLFNKKMTIQDIRHILAEDHGFDIPRRTLENWRQNYTNRHREPWDTRPQSIYNLWEPYRRTQDLLKTWGLSDDLREHQRAMKKWRAVIRCIEMERELV